MRCAPPPPPEFLSVCAVLPSATSLLHSWADFVMLVVPLADSLISCVIFLAMRFLVFHKHFLVTVGRASPQLCAEGSLVTLARAEFRPPAPGQTLCPFSGLTTCLCFSAPGAKRGGLFFGH